MKRIYKFIDWTNKEIGSFLILNKTSKKDKRGSYLWNVKCKLCGKIRERAVNEKELLRFECCKQCYNDRKFEKEINKKIPQWYINIIKRSAKERKIDFLVSDLYLFNLFNNQNKMCALSGVPIYFGKCSDRKSSHKYTTASLDRIDNNKGYIEGNVQWVHKDVNFMKQNYNEETFISFCSNISTNNINKNNKIKVLITGGAGYIGNILTPHLLNNGYQITIYDNLIHRQHSILTNANHENFKFVYGDVRNKDLYKQYIKSNDIIINLAAYVGAPLCSRFPIEAAEVNFDSACFLSDISSKNQKIIFPCTNSGYGIGQHINGKAVFCTEESPLNPISIYGSTKIKAESVLMSKGNCISLRLATVMGLSQKMRMDLLVNDFTYRAWNDGFIVLFESHFLRNFVHIKDVAQAFLHSIKKENMIGNVYNVGNTSANVNKMELCQRIKKYVPNFYITESPINKDPDQRNYIVSNEKIEATGWQPRFSLDHTIQEVLKACPIIKNSNVVFSDI